MIENVTLIRIVVFINCMVDVVFVAAAEHIGGFLVAPLVAKCVMGSVKPQGPDSIALISFGPFFSPFFGIAYCNSTQSKEFRVMLLANELQKTLTYMTIFFS